MGSRRLPLSLLSILGLAVATAAQVPEIERSVLSDLDLDGLPDLHEIVIGSLPIRVDTDGDTYSDVEEFARGSDPTDSTSTPGSDELGLGICASLEGDGVSFLSALYMKDSRFDIATYEMGIAIRGVVVRLDPGSLRLAHISFQPARNTQDSVAVIEIRVPRTIVGNLYGASIFGTLGKADPLAGPRACTAVLESLPGFASATVSGAPMTTGTPVPVPPGIPTRPPSHGTNGTWLMVARFPSSSFDASVVPAGSCSPIGSTVDVRIADVPNGVQLLFSHDPALDGLCPIGAWAYRTEMSGAIRECGTVGPTYDYVPFSRVVCFPGGTLDPVWAGPPASDSPPTISNPSSCLTTDVYVVERYVCQ